MNGFYSRAWDIVDVYSGVSADTIEGRMVAEMTDVIHEIEQLYAEALADASENYQASEQMGIEIDAETEPEIRYSARSFADQVDSVLNGADTNSSHLKVMKAPKLLQDAGLPDFPILMTAKHLKKITATSGHNLDVAMVKKLPEYISDPVLIADSLTRGDSIVVITEAVDSENRPVMAAIMLDGVGRLDSKHINANIMTSAYGRENFQEFLNRLAENNAVIYWNNKKAKTCQ